MCDPAVATAVGRAIREQHVGTLTGVTSAETDNRGESEGEGAGAGEDMDFGDSTARTTVAMRCNVLEVATAGNLPPGWALIALTTAAMVAEHYRRRRIHPQEADDVSAWWPQEADAWASVEHLGKRSRWGEDQLLRALRGAGMADLADWAALGLVMDNSEEVEADSEDQDQDDDDDDGDVAEDEDEDGDRDSIQMDQDMGREGEDSESEFGDADADADVDEDEAVGALSSSSLTDTGRPVALESQPISLPLYEHPFKGEKKGGRVRPPSFQELLAKAQDADEKD